MPRMQRGLAKGLIAAALALAAGIAPVSAADVRAARIWESPEYTRAVFDLAGPVEYKLFTLDNPARIVLDLKSSSLAGSYAVPTAKGAVKALRSGRPAPKDLRFVIDLAAAARPQSFLLPPAEGKGHRLVVDLYPKEASAPRV